MHLDILRTKNQALSLNKNMQDNLRYNAKDLIRYSQVGVISILIFGVFGFFAGFLTSLATWVFKLKSLAIFSNQNLVLIIFSIIIFLGFNFSLYYGEYLLDRKFLFLKNFNSKTSVYVLILILLAITTVYYFVFPRFIVFLYNTFWI